MVEKKGLKYHKGIVDLTKTEKEILRLITEEFLTIKQIAQRRCCSLQAVYKIIKKLKKKGSFNIGLKKVEKIEPTYNQTDIRLHGQELNIKIIWQDQKYQKLIEKSNILFLDSNTIRLYKNSIEIYLGQSFYGKTINEAEIKSLEYLERFLTRLEHDLKVSLLKNRARNIKIVNQHWARGESELSENAIKNKKRVWVYAEEDGKLCFITDDSFGFKEDETIHPITAKPDRKAIDKQINDWRLNNPPTQSEIFQIQAETGLQLKNLVNIVVEQGKMVSGLPIVLNNLEKQIKSHLALIQEYRKENMIWKRNEAKILKKEIKFGKQTTLNDWK
jgi:DNA-binding CsgD family transcriptional regulator